MSRGGGDELQALVNYYARDGYSRHVQTACAGGGDVARFWSAFSLIAQGSHSEAIGQLESLMRCVASLARLRRRRRRLHVPIREKKEVDSRLSLPLVPATSSPPSSSASFRHRAALLTSHPPRPRRVRPSIHSDRELELACMAACVHAHKQARVVDEESVEHLENRIAREEAHASPRSLLLCATFYSLAPSSAESWRGKELAERALETEPGFLEAKSLLAWIELTGAGGAAQEDEWDEDLGPGTPGGPAAKTDRVRVRLDAAKRMFDEVLDAPGGDTQLDALMGRVKVLEASFQTQGAMDVLNHVIARFPNFVPAKSEKAKTRMAAGDWDAAMDTAGEILDSAEGREDITALRVRAFHALSMEGAGEAAKRAVRDVLGAVDAREPRNAGLYLDCARDFARVSGGNESILSSCALMLERAEKIAPDRVDVVKEAAYQQQLLREYKAAIAGYRRAAQIDERDGALDDFTSLYGTIWCQLLDDQITDAEQQLEFLNDVTTERNVKLVFLTALHASKVPGADIETPLTELERLLTSHLAASRSRTFGFDYFVAMDPDLLTQCAELFLSRESGEPRGKNAPMSPGVEKALSLLEAVCARAPGLASARLLLMRTRYIAGHHDAAARTANALIQSQTDGVADAHIVLSQIALTNGDHVNAQSELDEAVASNFAIRDSPMYAIISAQCMVLNEDYEGGLKEIKAAMKLPGVKKAMTEAEKERARRKNAIPVSTRDRVSVYMMHAEVLTKLDRASEAEEVVNAASAEFKGTTEEVRVMIAQCELAMSKGESNDALKMLEQVSEDSPHFAKAKIALAKIHLEKRNDEEAYMRCYEDVSRVVGDVKSLVALADAYMRCGEAHMAVGVYEKAAAMNPGDVALAVKIGRALVEGHHFKKAMDYYEGFRASHPGETELQMDLARLYIQLGRVDPIYWPRAEAVLQQLLDTFTDARDPASLESGVECTRMLATVHLGEGNRAGYLDALTEAKELLSTLVTRSKSDVEASHKHRTALAGVCREIGEIYTKSHDTENASSFYHEALKHNPEDISAMKALAQMLLNVGDVGGCERMCADILRADADDEEANMMLAELMFQREDIEGAMYHFSQILDKNPGNYIAMAQLVQLLRRSGRLDECEAFFAEAETAAIDSSKDEGLFFCRGLAQRYKNNPREALVQLNKCRGSHEWGPYAVYTMVDIYLSPENEDVWDEEGNVTEEEGTQHENTDNVRAANDLLAEIRPVSRQHPRHEVLEAYALMGTRNKPAINRAIGILTEVVNKDHDNVPALLAMSSCFLMLKQTPKARNQLKRIAKLPFNSGEADEFERSWLLFAEINMKDKKRFEEARELCRKALKYNIACARAWELLGQMAEMETNVEEAARSYESSWRFSFESNPAVGYRLAKNYLKMKMFVHSIDVCKKVIKDHPDFPKIRQKILNKARISIKP